MFQDRHYRLNCFLYESICVTCFDCKTKLPSAACDKMRGTSRDFELGLEIILKQVSRAVPSGRLNLSEINIYSRTERQQGRPMATCGLLLCRNTYIAKTRLGRCNIKHHFHACASLIENASTWWCSWASPV